MEVDHVFVLLAFWSSKYCSVTCICCVNMLGLGLPMQVRPDHVFVLLHVGAPITGRPCICVVTVWELPIQGRTFIYVDGSFLRGLGGWVGLHGLCTHICMNF